MDPTQLPQVPYGPRFGDGARQGPSMDRRTFVALALGGLLAAPLTAEGQQTTKVPRIGFLAGGSRSADSLLLETFWLRLKERGYVIYPGKLTVTDSFRIGCIGQLYPDHMRGVLDAISAILVDMDVRSLKATKAA